jgi:hypothetical protein
MWSAIPIHNWQQNQIGKWLLANWQSNSYSEFIQEHEWIVATHWSVLCQFFWTVFPHR